MQGWGVKRGEHDASERPPSKMRALDNDKVRSMAVLGLKLGLANSQQIRQLNAVIFHTFAMDASHRAVVAMVDAGKAYAEAAKKAGKGHGLGPPHWHVWKALVESILGAEASKVEKSLLETVKTHYDSCGQKQIADIVKACRVSKQYDRSKMKLQLALAEGNKPLLEAVICYLVGEGAEHHMGAAPPTGQEREAQAFLDG